MCTKHITSYYSTYLIFCVSYTSSLNCINSPLYVALGVNVSLINYVQVQRLQNFKIQKVIKFNAHISPIFSCWVTYVAAITGNRRSYQKTCFNAHMEIPLILKEISSIEISAKLLNIKAQNYYKYMYYLCLYFYQIDKLLLQRWLTWTWYCDGYYDLQS